MSIKSDKWIRRMADSMGMIEPFESGQVRVDSNDQRIVSFGTSSYGYDVRCADEFTNSPIPHRYQPKYTRMRVWRKCCFSKVMRFAKRHTQTGVENIRANVV